MIFEFSNNNDKASNKKKKRKQKKKKIITESATSSANKNKLDTLRLRSYGVSTKKLKRLVFNKNVESLKK